MTLAPGLDLDLGATLEQIHVDEHAGRTELLGDLDFDDLPELAAWVGVQRQKWREQRDAALAAAVAQCEKTGAVARGLVYAQRLVESDPLAEHSPAPPDAPALPARRPGSGDRARSSASKRT